MRNYFKYLIYHFLSFVDSSVNLLCSVVGVYPKMDTGTSFLVEKELSRVDTEIVDRQATREKNLAKADFLVDAAHNAVGDVLLRAPIEATPPNTHPPAPSPRPRTPFDEVQEMWKPK